MSTLADIDQGTDKIADHVVQETVGPEVEHQHVAVAAHAGLVHQAHRGARLAAGGAEGGEIVLAQQQAHRLRHLRLVEREVEPAHPSRQQRRPEPPAVTIVPIARGHAGKTACLRTLHAGIRDGLPSGLRLGGGNPLEVVKDIRRFHETREQLASRGMTQTLAPEVFSIKLHQAENTAATVHIVDVIGQVLTHTMPDSPEDQLARYADYLKFLVAADVLWVIASPPCMDTAAATERWADDLSILRAYLVEALRQKVQPCSVALVVTKVDTLFSNEAEARRRLGEGALQSLLAPLVDVVRQSSRVSRGAIFPISSLGFGCAVKQNGKPASDERKGGN